MITRWLCAISLLLLITSAGQAQCAACQESSGNLVVNGDFSAGNTGFTTDLSLPTAPYGPWGQLSWPGLYAIDNNANDQHDFYEGFDHTNPPSGLFFIANGSASPTANAWCQTITVEANTDYTLSFWAQNVDGAAGGPPGILQLFANGVSVTTSETIEGDWEEITTVWNSGASTSLELCIKDISTAESGNDYGIDDIWVYTCEDIQLSQVIDAGEDIAVCSGQDAVIPAASYGGYTYTWTGPDGLNNYSTANPTINVVNDGPGDLVLTFQLEMDSASVGCLQADEINVTVIPLPVLDLGEDVVLCEGEQVLLNAGNGWEEVNWSTTETTQIISVDEAGTYTAEVSLNGCVDQDEIEVIMPDIPDVSLGPDVDLCEDESVTFTAPEVGTWQDSTMADNYETNLPGTYIVTLEEMGCAKSDTVEVNVFTYPEIDLGMDLTICPHDTVMLIAGYPSEWSTGEENADSILVSEPGYFSAVAVNGPCVSSDEVIINEIPYPEVELGEDGIICVGESVKLINEYDGDWEYVWNTGDSTRDLRIYDTGHYILSASNECKTVSDTVFWFFEECDWYVYIPNAFTPDQDGLNDVLEIHTVNLMQYDFMIFDRWGHKVFHGTDDSDRWTGNIAGGEFFTPNDVYFYRFTGKSNKLHLVELQGYITLLR